MKSNVIVYIGAFELPEGNAAAQRVRANATVLSALGYEVVLVGRNASLGYSGQQLCEKRYKEIDHKCFEMGYPKGYKEWLHYITCTAAVSNLIEREYAGRVHSIICYNFPAVAQFRIRQVARRVGARAVADVTEWYQNLRITSPSAIVKNFDTWLRMRIVNPRMDAIITTSKYLSQFYGRWFPQLIELPTLIEHEPSDVTELRATPDGELKKIFYGGSIIEKKALGMEKDGWKDRIDWVIELLDAVKQSGDDFRFSIYGVTLDAYLECRPDHAALLERLGESIRFYGRKPRKCLLDAQREADFSIFMRTSIRTTLAGFPTKFSESISFGTPVITNALDNILPYMQEGENCEIIEYDNFEQSVASIKACLALPAAEVLRRKLACRRSALFHPLSYVDEANKLFPDQRGVR